MNTSLVWLALPVVPALALGLPLQRPASVTGRVVKAALDEVLEGKDVQVVLNQETAVMWSVPGLDLTSAVIEQLNVNTSVAPK